VLDLGKGEKNCLKVMPSLLVRRFLHLSSEEDEGLLIQHGGDVGVSIVFLVRLAA
jgi:hypothetical protein